MTPRREGWSDVVLAACLTLAYGVLLLGTLDRLGYARDEGFYFVAARRYEEWFSLLATDSSEALARTDEFWRTNSEHPALIKSLFAWSHMIFGDVFRREGTSFRFPAIALSALGVGVVYLWGARVSGRLAGMIAALSLSAMPRFFFHAHLACFDAPVVTMWSLCAYSYWRALDRGGLLRAVLVGVTFALALNTKHNAWFLPIVFALHALSLWFLDDDGRRDDDGRLGEGGRSRFRRSATSIAAMAVIGPLLFYATWPWIWDDTVARLRAYAMFHLEHVYYNMEYLGQNHYEPPMPRTYAFVMTAATVPVITLALFGYGVVKRAAVARHTWLLWALAIVVQYGAWLRPTTPIFGGTKHWMTAYPFIALFAGVGAAAAVRFVSTRHAYARSIGFRVLFAVTMVVPGVVQSARAHPWGLSAYTPLVGGAAGAADLGLNRGFWGYTTGAVAAYLNEHAPRRARVYVHDTAWASWQMLIADGRLRSDLIGVGHVGDADIALYHHELHMQGVEYQTWVAFESVAPVHIAGLDGVPVIWIYQRRQ